MKKQDRVFDRLADRFHKRIYGSNKGQIRLEIVKSDLQDCLSLDQPVSPRTILDAGGGFGQMSIWLAQQGHSLTLCEPSRKMLSYARQAIVEASVDKQITTECSMIQDLPTGKSYDIILFHAVLEWLAEPKRTLKGLLEHLRPGGYMSLMFYNRNSVAMRSLLGGDFERVRNDQLEGVGNKGLTPINPLVPEDVLHWLKEWDAEVLSWTGIRTFYDYMKPEAMRDADLDEVVLMEKMFAKKEPWRSLARYQHIIFQIPG